MAKARLKTRYLEEIRPALMERFGYSTPMRAPRVDKVTVNMGVGDAKQDSKVLEAASEQLATITGQRPNVRRARKSIAQFKVREGMPVGVAVTLRGERSLEFLDRLMSVAIPRIRDFRGLSPGAFDGRGNYSLGVREQIIFPEVDYDEIDQVRGLDITITTTAHNDEEAFALLEMMGMPFSRPAGSGAGAGAGASAPRAAAPAPPSPPAEAEEAPEVAEAAGEIEHPEEPPESNLRRGIRLRGTRVRGRCSARSRGRPPCRGGGCLGGGSVERGRRHGELVHGQGFTTGPPATDSQIQNPGVHPVPPVWPRTSGVPEVWPVSHLPARAGPRGVHPGHDEVELVARRCDRSDR